MDPPPIHRPGFNLEWTPVRQEVLAYCASKLRDHHLAEDVTERVAIRALHGYAEFRGEATFLSWVLGIAWREIAREFPRILRRAKRETPLVHSLHDSIPDESNPPPSAEAEDLPDLPSLGEMIERGAATAWLSPVEVKVLELQLRSTELTWEEIGAQLGLSAMAAKLHLHRARHKLRVILFLHLRVSLSGADLIAEAFATARKNPAKPMSAAEIEVFESVIVRQDQSPHLAGVKDVLLTACKKVSDCFERGLAGALLSVIAYWDEEK